jgi:hypothetical protein
MVSRGEALAGESVISLSIWILFLFIPSVNCCFYICAGLRCHDVSGTVTDGEMFVGILKVA